MTGSGNVIFEQKPSRSYWYEEAHAVTGEFLIVVVGFDLCFPI